MAVFRPFRGVRPVPEHAADVAARMPEGDRHAGTEQRRDARPALAEMEVTRPENDGTKVRRGRCADGFGLPVHGLR